MKFHPLADIFPLIDGAEFEALVDAIERHASLAGIDDLASLVEVFGADRLARILLGDGA